MKVQILCVFACALITATVRAGEAHERHLPRVVMITLSGIRAEDTIEDQAAQYMPHLVGEMIPAGCLYTNLVDLNYQFHMPSVSAIITGTTYRWSDKLNSPSIFQYVRKQYDLPAEKVWSLGGWVINGCVFETDDFPESTFPCQIASLGLAMSDNAKASLLPYVTPHDQDLLESCAEISTNPLSRWPQWDSVGDIQFYLLEKVMEHVRPIFVHYIMNDVEAAHYGTRGRYLHAVKRTDQKIKRIWERIQDDPFYAGKTYLIVSSDHARNQYYMHHYRGLFEGAPPVWLYLYGPDINSGVIGRTVHNIDIFATLAWLYGVPTHENLGRPLHDAFLPERVE